MMKGEGRYQFIGRKISEAREAMGWSQKKLAEELDFKSATAISLIEAGERRASVELLEKISEKLKRDIKFFLGKEFEEVDISTALRSQKDLSEEDKKYLIQFIELAKDRQRGK